MSVSGKVCLVSVYFVLVNSYGNEPRHDKTNNVAVRPAKTQISLGIRPVWSESSLSAWRKLGSLATRWAHSADWSDWADAQADLSLRWAHIHFVGFVMSRLKCNHKGSLWFIWSKIYDWRIVDYLQINLFFCRLCQEADSDICLHNCIFLSQVLKSKSVIPIFTVATIQVVLTTVNVIATQTLFNSPEPKDHNVSL